MGGQQQQQQKQQQQQQQQQRRSKNGGPASPSHSSRNPVLRFAVMACGLVTVLLVVGTAYLTKLHHEVVTTRAAPGSAVAGDSAGGFMPPAPGAADHHPVLAAAADARRLATDRLVGQSWQGLRNSQAAAGVNRSAGPFHNLAGPVGNARFTYADIIPEVDLATYPPTESLLDIVKRWNPDDTDRVPDPFHETLQVFNFSDPEQRAVAEKYRTAEVPFKVFGIPDVDKVVERWTDPYLEKNMESRQVSYKIETSPRGNHFMYWVNRGLPKHKFTPPTEKVSGMRFSNWLKKAKDADAIGLDAEEEHFYLMTGVEAGRLVARNERRLGQFISSDLDIFSTTKNNFFITNVQANKGIQCRFGMKGVIAEAHYDGGRNMVAMLKGAKRYILNPPSECALLDIIADKGHPSYRHSTTDWSNEDEARAQGFEKARGIDTIVREGEILYIPSYWFHYIISLDYSIQCNSRSGPPPNANNEQHIKKCMGQGSTPPAKRSSSRKKQRSLSGEGFPAGGSLRGAAKRKSGAKHKKKGGEEGGMPHEAQEEARWLSGGDPDAKKAMGDLIRAAKRKSEV